VIERSVRRIGPVEMPVIEARGVQDGPRACLIAGIHGCEYASMEALMRFMRSLDTSTLTGSIVAAPIVNVTAFRGRSPFVTPEDGMNLNRCFPGSADGTHSEQLAHAVFMELISGSDLLIDLHGGDLVEALEPFTLFDASPVATRAEQLARAYGLRYVIRGPEQRIEGTTSAAAADAGIPGITPEAGGCGLMEEAAIQAHTDGLANALRAAGMLEGEHIVRDDLRMVSRFVWLRAAQAGWWAADIGAGDEVRAGERLGAMRDLTGGELDVIEAPEDGVILFLTSSPAVAEDGILLGLGAGFS
jgi:predicted deacylase